MNKIFRQTVAGLCSGAVLLTGISVMPYDTANAAGDCIIDSGTTYQTIRGFGGMNLPEWMGSDLTAIQRQTAFGNGENEMGLSILRIYISDDSNAWSNAVQTALAAQQNGATVFATPWNPPASMRSTGSGGANGGKYVLNSGSEAQYAKHLNDYIKYMEGQGVNLYSVSVQNEPDYSEDWTYWSPERCASFLANYSKTVTAGTNAKMMSPETFQYGKSYYNAILENAEAFANTDLFGTHFYGTQRSQMDFAALENCGKEIWMTEVYVPNSEADSANRWPESLKVAENIHNGLVVGNMSAYTWWYIRRSYGLMTEDGNISKRGWNMAAYSKNIRPGAVRIAATESPVSNLLISAYQGTQGEITVVAINMGSGSVTQNFVLGSGETIKDLQGWRTSEYENYAAVSGLQYSENSFSASLPASSVTTFVISGKEAEPDPDGYFYHDTFESTAGTWQGRGDATVQIADNAAYQGSKSLLVQDRAKAWNGATRSINASVFQPGKTYSFSAVVMYPEGSATDTFYMKLQYTDAAGDAQYSTIAEATAVKGEWVQLFNTSYAIPDDAKNMQIYIETADSINSFYVDDAIGAPEGTVIEGPIAVSYRLGDLNDDGKINAVDLTFAKRGVIYGFSDKVQQIAADINRDGNVSLADLIWMIKYLEGIEKSFPE